MAMLNMLLKIFGEDEDVIMVDENVLENCGSVKELKGLVN